LAVVRAALAALICWTLALAASADEADPRPFDRDADAAAQIDAALAEAEQDGKRALIVFGANWCHDSRGLARKLRDEAALSALIDQHFALAYVDVGVRNRNLDQLARFGLDGPYGTPTLAIAEPDGALLNAATAHDWRAVNNAGAADIYAYLAAFSAARPHGILTGARSVDIGRAAAAFAPYQAAMEAVKAGETGGESGDYVTGYARGLARSMTRYAMGERADADGAPIVSEGDLFALGLTAQADLTDAVIEDMRAFDFDVLERLARDRRDAAD